MTISEEQYKEKAKNNELYNSWWKLCKDRLDNAIKENEKECTIIMPISNKYESTTFSASCYEMEVLTMIESSIKLVYNCNIEVSFEDTGYITIKVNWSDNVVPYSTK